MYQGITIQQPPLHEKIPIQQPPLHEKIPAKQGGFVAGQLLETQIWTQMDYFLKRFPLSNIQIPNIFSLRRPKSASTKSADLPKTNGVVGWFSCDIDCIKIIRRLRITIPNQEIP